MAPPDTVTDDSTRPSGVLEMGDELVDNIAALLDAEEYGMVLNIVADLYPADVAQLLHHLPFDEARRLFGWLPLEQGSDVLAELDSAFRTELLKAVQSHRITALVEELETDDAADVLGDLPDEVAFSVLSDLTDAEDVRELLGYGADTAGGIMGTEFVAVQAHHTVAEVTEEVRRMAEIVEPMHVVYVVDEADRLEGIMTLKQLLLCRADARVEEVMKTDIISVPTHLDQEEVALIMERYDLVALPVIDSGGRLVGRITIDDVVDVIREEAEEDLQRMSGVSGGEEVTASAWRVVRGRLPWLVAGLLGAGLSATVIGAFESALEQAVVLAAFIPIVMATAGNAGIQSSAIAVQGLASGDVWASDMPRRLGKELTVAIVNGVALAALLGLGVLGLAQVGLLTADAPSLLAATAAVCLVVVIVLATAIGALVPLLLFRVNVDPAIATGPFITTSNDIIGILVFFLLASWIYLG